VDKRCSCCKEAKLLSDFYKNAAQRDGHYSYCKSCWRVKVSQWHEDNPEAYERILAKRSRKPRASTSWGRRNPEKKRAQWAVFYAVKTGRLIKPDECSRCGRTGRIEGHHFDYSRPLDVEWLCTRCHGRVTYATKESF